MRAEGELMDAMQQMNVRVGSEVKKRGDAALRRRRLTPSEGIRAFYSVLARGDEMTERLLDLVFSRNPSPAGSDSARHERSIEIERFLSALSRKREEINCGPDASVWDAQPNDREAYLCALEARYEERGLL